MIAVVMTYDHEQVIPPLVEEEQGIREIRDVTRSPPSHRQGYSLNLDLFTPKYCTLSFILLIVHVHKV